MIDEIPISRGMRRLIKKNPYGVCHTPLRMILAYANPVVDIPWAKVDVSASAFRREVLACIRENRVDHRPYYHVRHTDEDGVRYHAMRIAYLVKHPQETPIEIDFSGIGIEDGNHRLYAAHVRKDKTIPVLFYGFSISKAGEACQPSYCA